jgi:hypothetical protein
VLELVANLTEADTPRDAWMTAFVEAGHQHDAGGALQMLFARVDDFVDEGKFEELDEFMRFFELEKLRSELLVGLLRITVPFRDKLSSWLPMLGVSYQILGRRGLDAKKVLVGLLG